MPSTSSLQLSKSPSNYSKDNLGKLDGRPLPNNLDAEQGLIAACILDSSGEVIGRCLENSLSPDHFHFHNHQLIYEVLVQLHQENSEPDEILIAEKLSLDGNLEKIGGKEAIFELSSRIDTTAHAPFWLDIVKQKAMLRKCILVGFEIIDGANNVRGEVQDFLADIEQRVCSLGDEQNIKSSVPFREPVQHAMEQIQRMLSHEEMDGLLSGYSNLDQLTNGFKPAEMIVIAARPSVGKTSLAMNIVENVAFSPKYKANPKNILVFSLEMSSTSLAMRMICGKAKINMNDLRRGFVPKKDAEAINAISREFQNSSLWVDDTSGLSINQIRAKARRLKSRKKLHLIVVDYLQLISGDSRTQSRENQIADISRGLKAMAKELDVPVIVLSQLNRDSEKERREPRLSDLRESGSIEQDADIVMLLGKQRKGEDIREVDQESEESPAEEDYEPITLLLAKQRNGPTGRVNLAFRRKYTRFEVLEAEPRLN